MPQDYADKPLIKQIQDFLGLSHFPNINRGNNSSTLHVSYH